MQGAIISRNLGEVTGRVIYTTTEHMAPNSELSIETDTVYPSTQCLWSFSSSVGYDMLIGVKSKLLFRRRRLIRSAYADDALHVSLCPVGSSTTYNALATAYY
jgi:hypothetical protein